MFEAPNHRMPDAQETDPIPGASNEQTDLPALGSPPEAVQEKLAARIADDSLLPAEAVTWSETTPAELSEEKPATPEGGNGGEEPPAEIRHASGDEGDDHGGKGEEQAEASEHQSNLSPELQELVRTPEFKSWFGDWENDPANASKIVDEHGEPLLTYIAAPAGGRPFTAEHRDEHTSLGENAFFATTKEPVAKALAEQFLDPVTDEPIPASVYGAFISMKNPYELGGDNSLDRLVAEPEEPDGFIDEKSQMVVFDSGQIFVVSETPHEDIASDETTLPSAEAVPSSEAPSESAETELSPELVVDHRRAGNAELTVALWAHGPENWKAAAEAVKDCDVLAFEWILNIPGGRGDEDEQRYIEQALTKLLSSKVDPELADAALAKGVELGYNVYGVLSHFRGTDKEVKLLDISAGEMRRLPDMLREYETFYADVAGLAPLQKARSSCFDYLEASIVSQKVRNEHMAERLNEIAHEAGQQPEPISVGVLMGATHWSVATSVSEAVDPEASEQVLEKATQFYSPEDWAVIAGADGNAEVLRAQGERALLAKYMLLSTQVMTNMQKSESDASFLYVDNAPLDMRRRVEQAALALEDAQVASLLGQLELDLSAPDLRAGRVLATLEPVTRPILSQLKSV